MLATWVQDDTTWTFERLKDGSVQISKFEMMDGLGMGEHLTIPNLLWCALIAVMAPSGPTSNALVSALLLNDQKFAMKELREAVAAVTASPETLKSKRRDQRLKEVASPQEYGELEDDEDTDEQDIFDEMPEEPEIE